MGTAQFTEELRKMSTGTETDERTSLDVIADALDSLATSVAQSEINIKRELGERLERVEERLDGLEEKRN